VGRLLRAYGAAGLKCGKGLRPPATEEEMDRVARRLGVRLPPSLRAVWRVHGGQRYVSPGITGLFGKHRLHSPSELAGSYLMFRRYGPDPTEPFPSRSGKVVYFHPRLIPIASWDVYNLCLDSATGEVWEFSPNYGLGGGTSRPSLRALVAELLALMRDARPPEPDFICVRPRIEPRWLTADVLGLARGIVADQGIDRLPILADALQEAGCDDKRILRVCRGRRKYPGGWWLIDLLLGQA
jgi:hypothetical protein